MSTGPDTVDDAGCAGAAAGGCFWTVACGLGAILVAAAYDWSFWRGFVVIPTVGLLGGLFGAVAGAFLAVALFERNRS